MTVKIGSKIVGYKVVPKGATPEPVSGDREAVPASNVVHMHEAFQRPERLVGSTYKVKTPMSEHALYITVNDVILNEITHFLASDSETRAPGMDAIKSAAMYCHCALDLCFHALVVS